MSVLHLLKLSIVLPTALLALLSPADAGLSDTNRGLLPIIYQEKVATIADRAVVNANWKDSVDDFDWQQSRGVTVKTATMTGADGDPLLVTMLNATMACGKRECPVRIYTAQGALLFETMACYETDQHFFSADRRSFIACDLVHPLPSPREVLAPQRLASRALWHNGSIMDAAFGGDDTLSIRYLEPRGGLGNVRGQLVFEGRVTHKHFVEGTAYTFKSGCAPAAYAVRGQIDPRGNIDLYGDAPMRDTRSCAVIGFTPFSPHARLRFVGPAFASR